MANIKLVNTNINTFFENNKIEISNSIPTSGTHHVGDIVIKETQEKHMAIGWICIQAGTPGTWSEFGGMFEDDEPLVLDPESVGMNELSSEVKSKLLIGDTLIINVQALQNAVNRCATKEDLKNIDLSLYATKEDLNAYATKEEMNSVETWLEGVESDVYRCVSSIGNTSSLNTNNKTDLVSAINEVFQSGVNVKQNLVDALIAKGVDCSTSNSFDELIECISEMSMNAFVDWAKANTWLVAGACTNMPATRYQMAAASYKNKIYVMGGYNAVKTLYVYDIKTNTWETKKEMITGRYGLDSVTVGDKIYAIGGYNNLTTNEMYDIKTDTWVTKTAMTTGREYFSSGVVGTDIYCIGGSGATAYATTNEMYDTITDTWSSKATMTVGKYGHSCGAIGNIVYAVGGYTGSIVKTNYAYDTTTDTWTTKTAVTAGRRYATAEVVDGLLYYIGGENASSTYYKTIYCYDPTTNAWTTMTAEPVTRSKGCSGSGNGMIFHIGGKTGSALATMDCYII